MTFGSVALVATLALATLGTAGAQTGAGAATVDRSQGCDRAR